MSLIIQIFNKDNNYEKPETIKAELKITVTYDCNETTEAEIKRCLEQAANHLSGEGFLEANLPAIVDTWDFQVTTKVIK
jgi:hypothetical protein